MSLSDHRNLVTRSAGELGLLDAQGNLLKLDSLAVIDFVVALEDATQLMIPVASLRPDVFRSIDSIAQMLVDLRSGVTPSPS